MYWSSTVSYHLLSVNLPVRPFQKAFIHTLKAGLCGIFIFKLLLPLVTLPNSLPFIGLQLQFICTTGCPHTSLNSIRIKVNFRSTNLQKKSLRRGELSPQWFLFIENHTILSFSVWLKEQEGYLFYWWWRKASAWHVNTYRSLSSERHTKVY